jgi:hypothetical protein
VYSFVGDSPPHDIGTAFILPTVADFVDPKKFKLYVPILTCQCWDVYLLFDVFPFESQYIILHSVRTEILRGLIIVVASAVSFLLFVLPSSNT